MESHMWHCVWFKSLVEEVCLSGNTVFSVWTRCSCGQSQLSGIVGLYSGISMDAASRIPSLGTWRYCRWRRRDQELTSSWFVGSSPDQCLWSWCFLLCFCTLCRLCLVYSNPCLSTSLNLLSHTHHFFWDWLQSLISEFGASARLSVKCDL